MPLCYVDFLLKIIVCPNPCVDSPTKMICTLDVMLTSFTVIYAHLQRRSKSRWKYLFSFYSRKINGMRICEWKAGEMVCFIHIYIVSYSFMLSALWNDWSTNMCTLPYVMLMFVLFKYTVINGYIIYHR